jgi:hypothetical protein
LRLRWRLLLLLLLGRSRLEWLLLRSLGLLELALLPRIASVLRLLWLLWLLWLLLPKPLRLARKASVLRLHWTSAKTCRLRSQSTLKASLLSIRLLLLLAILGLPRAGAVAAP